MFKHELRKLYRKERVLLSNEKIDMLSQKIFENFLLNFPLQEKQKIHLFLPIKKLKEVDTQYFIQYCFQTHIRVFVPKIVKDKMISVEISAKTIFLENDRGILEPIENSEPEEKNFDYIITPLLVCDKKGNRIGYGKGFYDRFFSEINDTNIKVGISFFPPKEQIDDVSKEDIPLDYLVTPEEVFSFRESR